MDTKTKRTPLQEATWAAREMARLLTLDQRISLSPENRQWIRDHVTEQIGESIVPMACPEPWQVFP